MHHVNKAATASGGRVVVEMLMLAVHALLVGVVTSVTCVLFVIWLAQVGT